MVVRAVMISVGPAVRVSMNVTTAVMIGSSDVYRFPICAAIAGFQ